MPRKSSSANKTAQRKAGQAEKKKLLEAQRREALRRFRAHNPGHEAAMMGALLARFAGR